MGCYDENELSQPDLTLLDTDKADIFLKVSAADPFFLIYDSFLVNLKCFMFLALLHRPSVLNLNYF